MKAVSVSPLVAQLSKRWRKEGVWARQLMGRPTPVAQAAYFPWGANNFAKIHGGTPLCAHKHTHKSTLANRIRLAAPRSLIDCSCKWAASCERDLRNYGSMIKAEQSARGIQPLRMLSGDAELWVWAFDDFTRGCAINVDVLLRSNLHQCII